MKKEQLVKKIKLAVKKDQKNRKDPRYLKIMALLTTKGFLFANRKFPRWPNLRVSVDEAIWAGINVEPRILEVLPAAVLRLGKRFDFDPTKHKELAPTLEDLRGQKGEGRDFLNVPYKKLKVWVDFQLKDKRVKTFLEKKITRTYRLSPETVKKLKSLSLKSHKNETRIIEEAISRI